MRRLIVGTAGLALFGCGSAADRIEAGAAKPGDFVRLCADALQSKARDDAMWAGATLNSASPEITRSERPQEVVCTADWRDGSRVQFSIRVICGEGADCVNYL